MVSTHCTFKVGVQGAVLVMKEMTLASPRQAGSRRVQKMAIFGCKTHREPWAMIQSKL